MESKKTAKVRMRHPHTGDEVEVDSAHDTLVPYMVQGYTQVTEPRPGDAGGPAEEQVTLAEPEKE
jgi:hypothetical protein